MLINEQGTVYHLAVPVELLLWPIPAMEDPHDSRHLPLAPADHACSHCRSSMYSAMARISLLLVVHVREQILASSLLVSIPQSHLYPLTS